MKLIFLTFFSFSIFFWPHSMACGILVPWPGIESRPLAVGAQSPNHWTTREFPLTDFKKLCTLATSKVNSALEKEKVVLEYIYDVEIS